MNESSRDKWLNTLKAGDRVVVRTRRVDGAFSAPTGPVLYTIKNITAKRTRFDLFHSSNVESTETALSCNRYGSFKTGNGAWTNRFNMEPYVAEIDAEIARDDLKIAVCRRQSDLINLLKNLQTRNLSSPSQSAFLSLSEELIKLLQANKS